MTSLPKLPLKQIKRGHYPPLPHGVAPKGINIVASIWGTLTGPHPLS